MLATTISDIFTRDLKKLAEEIKLYKTEEDVWKIPNGVLNSGGTLCLHICGNLNHFVGTVLGNTGYVRNRDKEFAERNIPKAVLVREVEQTIAAVTNTMKGLSDKDLELEYGAMPPQLAEMGKTRFFFLIHLISHADYHIGQINYHRRMVTGIEK